MGKQIELTVGTSLRLPEPTYIPIFNTLVQFRGTVELIKTLNTAELISFNHSLKTHISNRKTK